MTTSTPIEKEIITIQYQDLQSISTGVPPSLLEKIGKAYGNHDDSLGILIVSGIPSLPTLRNELLPLARDLASLSPSELDAVTVPSAGYSVGWSHGKERVQGEDKFDTAKGSFYANPLTDGYSQIFRNRFGKEKEVEDLIQKNPAFFADNVWPSALPQLEIVMKDAGKLIHDIGRMIAKCCDAYVATQCSGYNPSILETVLTESKYCKARLLHYFPSSENNGGFSDWCGWHNDHGSLTGLLPAIYLDKDGKRVDCPDGLAGLYIKSRRGDLVRVRLPPDCLAFQVGETTQIHTGGILQATPHAVRGCNSNEITRESFAVFMEPEYDGDMNLPPGKRVEDAQNRDAESYLPETVRPLRLRWRDGMNFGQFSDATFAAFY